MTDVLLVLYKPSGVVRTCTAQEAVLFAEAWNAVLDWLNGADPDELPHAQLVGEVARKAALRTPRSPDHDVTLWMRQARDVPRLQPSGARDLRLPAMFGPLLTNLGLTKTEQRVCRLNRIAIELLYGTTPAFQRHRDLLTRRLLEGPVLIQGWQGERKALAQAGKVLIRRSLSTENLTNLLHAEPVAIEHLRQLSAATEVPNMPEWALPAAEKTSNDQ